MALFIINSRGTHVSETTCISEWLPSSHPPIKYKLVHLYTYTMANSTSMIQQTGYFSLPKKKFFTRWNSFTRCYFIFEEEFIIVFSRSSFYFPNNEQSEPVLTHGLKKNECKKMMERHYNIYKIGSFFWRSQFCTYLFSATDAKINGNMSSERYSILHQNSQTDKKKRKFYNAISCHDKKCPLAKSVRRVFLSLPKHVLSTFESNKVGTIKKSASINHGAINPLFQT